jgi:RNA polymerase subunit RPABC4/transcription elongation factor Spt4
MSLMKCPDCSRDVSSDAEKCPHCGRVIKEKQTAAGMAAAIVIGLVLGVLLLKACGYM